MIEQCQVGMFNLPGVKIVKTILPEELIAEMQAWARENHCGTMMSDQGGLWSFRTKAQRDWFILRWTDSIPKSEAKEGE